MIDVLHDPKYDFGCKAGFVADLENVFFFWN